MLVAEHAKAVHGNSSLLEALERDIFLFMSLIQSVPAGEPLPPHGHGCSREKERTSYKGENRNERNEKGRKMTEQYFAP